MSSHIHIPGTYDKFTNLGVATFDTLLDSIVADVAAAVAAGTNNNWTLHDDQRTLAGHAGVYGIPCHIGGFLLGWGTSGLSITNGTTALTSVGTACRLGFRWKVGLTELNTSAGWPNFTPTGTWVGLAAIPSDSSATLASNWPNATADKANGSGRVLVEKAFGYIILKCTSAQKTFYVQLVRPKNYSDPLRCRVWETWDAATHTGTVASNMEILRGYQGSSSGAGAITYCLFLLPETFALYAGRGDNTVTVTWQDLYYAGNLVSANAGDTNALVAACTNTELSGFSPPGPGNLSSASSDCDGAAQILRTVAGASVWTALANGGNGQDYTTVSLRPRANTYLASPLRRPLDGSQRLPMVGFDAFSILPRAWSEVGSSYEDNRRGELRHIRTPQGNPSYMQFLTFGPAEDGKTYIMLRCAYPFGRGPSNNTTGADADISSAYAHSGWAYKVGNNGTRDEIVNANTNILTLLHRWFLLPLDL